MPRVDLNFKLIEVYVCQLFSCCLKVVRLVMSGTNISLFSFVCSYFTWAFVHSILSPIWKTYPTPMIPVHVAEYLDVNGSVRKVVLSRFWIPSFSFQC